MFCRFSSLITLAGLFVVASGHGSMSQLSAQGRACPIDGRTTEVRTLTRAADDKLGRSPAAQLIAHLSSDFQGTISIPSDITVDMGSARLLSIGPCVTLSGTRGGLDPGALITTADKEADGPVFFVSGPGVRIEGLRFRGPMTTDDRSARDESIKAFAIIGAPGGSVSIDNNVFEFWSMAVVIARDLSSVSCRDMAPVVRITRNYFNRNAIEEKGYGVGVGSGCVTIEGNLFNKNRHAVAASGTPEAGPGVIGYVAKYNYVLEGGFTVCPSRLCYWNQHFDVHGSIDGYGGEAGEYFEIIWNTIRGEQGYYQTQTRPAFMLRGRPTLGAYFHNNVVVHDTADKAVRLKDPGLQCLEYGPTGTTYSWKLCNLDVASNRYNTDMINELAVGDFDADGIDDLFLANGTAWWYSSAGVTEWRFLRASTLRVQRLRFGDFTGDARTDVLYSAASDWYVSSGGTASPVRWREDGTRLTDCVFGDFNKDGVTDALRADGSTWSIATNGNGPWVFQRDYWVKGADLRAADFTNDGYDDVFWITAGTWNLWDSARNVWTRDHRKPVSEADMPLMVIADFDGDGRADLAKSDADGWIWMQTGTTFWARLRWNADQSEYKDIRAAVFGRFTVGDRSADAIRYASSRFSDSSKYGFALWSRAIDRFIPWSPDWVEMR